VLLDLKNRNSLNEGVSKQRGKNILLRKIPEIRSYRRDIRPPWQKKGKDVFFQREKKKGKSEKHFIREE